MSKYDWVTGGPAGIEGQCMLCSQRWLLSMLNILLKRMPHCGLGPRVEGHRQFFEWQDLYGFVWICVDLWVSLFEKLRILILKTVVGKKMSTCWWTKLSRCWQFRAAACHAKGQRI
jgi:hypothetical protein